MAAGEVARPKAATAAGEACLAACLAVVSVPHLRFSRLWMAGKPHPASPAFADVDVGARHARLLHNCISRVGQEADPYARERRS